MIQPVKTKTRETFKKKLKLKKKIKTATKLYT